MQTESKYYEYAAGKQRVSQSCCANCEKSCSNTSSYLYGAGPRLCHLCDTFLRDRLGIVGWNSIGTNDIRAFLTENGIPLSHNASTEELRETAVIIYNSPGYQQHRTICVSNLKRDYPSWQPTAYERSWSTHTALPNTYAMYDGHQSRKSRSSHAEGERNGHHTSKSKSKHAEGERNGHHTSKSKSKHKLADSNFAVCGDRSCTSSHDESRVMTHYRPKSGVRPSEKHKSDRHRKSRSHSTSMHEKAAVADESDAWHVGKSENGKKHNSKKSSSTTKPHSHKKEKPGEVFQTKVMYPRSSKHYEPNDTPKRSTKLKEDKHRSQPDRIQPMSGYSRAGKPASAPKAPVRSSSTSSSDSSSKSVMELPAAHQWDAAKADEPQPMWIKKNGDEMPPQDGSVSSSDTDNEEERPTVLPEEQNAEEKSSDRHSPANDMEAVERRTVSREDREGEEQSSDRHSPVSDMEAEELNELAARTANEVLSAGIEDHLLQREDSHSSSESFPTPPVQHHHSPQRVTRSNLQLSTIQSADEIEEMSIIQLMQLLSKGGAKCEVFHEREELVEMVKDLWKDGRRAPAGSRTGWTPMPSKPNQQRNSFLPPPPPPPSTQPAKAGSTRKVAAPPKICMVCEERPIDGVIASCNHTVGCRSCLDKLYNCPLCRMKISVVKRLN